MALAIPCGKNRCSLTVTVGSAGRHSFGRNPTLSASNFLNHFFPLFYTYILKSLKDNKYYYGSTEDLQRRIKYHNSGKVRSTKNRRPFVIHYFEEYNSKTEAIKRESFFKTKPGYLWLKNKGII